MAATATTQKHPSASKRNLKMGFHFYGFYGCAAQVMAKIFPGFFRFQISLPLSHNLFRTVYAYNVHHIDTAKP